MYIERTKPLYHSLKILSKTRLPILLVYCFFAMYPSYSVVAQTAYKDPIKDPYGGYGSDGKADTINTAVYRIPRKVLAEGGAMRYSTANHILYSTFGQPITGIQTGDSRKVFSGFWNYPLLEISGDDPELPEEFALFQNYPNPFNNVTIIGYALPKESKVKILIYDILGRKVRILLDQQQEAGYKEILWNGKNNSGVEVGSGIYFYQIEAEDFSANKKMILLK